MSANNIPVTVLLPVFNEKPSFLKLAAESILKQSFDNFELLLFDDGSDQTETIHALEAIKQSDPRIRFYRHRNAGLARTLNRGISLARGCYLCRQDSDDWSERDRIARQVAFLERNPSIGIVGSNFMFHQENGRPLWPSNLPLGPDAVMAAFPTRNPFAHGATFFRRDLALAVSGYREVFSTGQDYDFFWRLCERAGGANLPEILYHHRRTATSVTTLRDIEKLRIPYIIREAGMMRAQGLEEDLCLARERVKEIVKTEDLATKVVRKHGDHMMMAGYYREALRAYLKTVTSCAHKPLGYFCIIRLLLFVGVSPMRRWLFK